jgi:Oxidoreductase family, NAD-binding Rossmann fold
LDRLVADGGPAQTLSAGDSFTMTALVKNPKDIRLGMVGMLPDNHHPFSWGAIINGRYDRDRMAQFADAVISRYLGAQPADALGIAGARVTHIWSDQRELSEQVAAAALIPNVVSHPEEVIGSVDAVLIPTDIGHEHLERCRPFVQAGLPVFIDKPLTDNEAHLREFERWGMEDKPIMSCSALRYSREFAGLRDRLSELGDLRLITITMVKNWARYGIHALEAVYPFLPPGGWTDVIHTGTNETNIVHLRHEQGVSVVVAVVEDMFGGMGNLCLYGTKGNASAQFTDSFTAFKAQLSAFVAYLRTGRRPFACEQTLELMRMIIGAQISRDEGGRRVALAELSQPVRSGY